MNFQDINSYLSEFIEKKFPESFLLRFQEFILENGVFIVASQLIANLFLSIIVLIIVFSILSLIFNFSLIFVFIISVVIPLLILITYIFVKGERRSDEIEKTAPDFLRQLASMLRVGLSFENSMDDISKYGSGPLYDEIRRTVIEIKMGKNFDDSITALTNRLNSKSLKRTFNIILEGKKSGGGLADIIDNVVEDLRAILILKRERKASIMMAISFLAISAAIAAPFALGMIGIYSSFMTSLGRGSELIETAVLAAGFYIIIHSILVGFLIGLIMYGDFKKGVKFSIPLTIVSYSIFYTISNFGAGFLNF